MTTPQPPQFSVVIVCRNAVRHVADALDSVLAQTCQDFELLVVDGDSTDGTLDLVKAAASRSDRVRWISEPDDGLYDAMNKGIDLAVGEYVLYLGADDLLEPGALGAVASALRVEPRADIVCGATLVFDSERSWEEPAREVIRRGMAQRAPSRHQSIAVRRDLLKGTGGFDASYPIAADYDLYLRLVEAGATRRLVPQRLSRFRLGGVSSASALRTAREYERVRVSHGANRMLERLVMLKSVAAATVFRVLRLGRRTAEGGV